MPQRYGISTDNNFALRAPTVLTAPALPSTAVSVAPVVEPSKPVPAVSSRLAPYLAPPAQAGKFIHQAERVPQVRACNGQSSVTLTGAVAGVEVYDAKCASGEVLMVRCEWGSCRALR